MRQSSRFVRMLFLLITSISLIKFVTSEDDLISSNTSNIIVSSAISPNNIMIPSLTNQTFFSMMTQIHENDNKEYVLLFIPLIVLGYFSCCMIGVICCILKMGRVDDQGRSQYRPNYRTTYGASSSPPQKKTKKVVKKRKTCPPSQADYKSKLDKIQDLAKAGNRFDQTDCPICFEEFECMEDELITELKCGHKFCTNCLEVWFLRQREEGKLRSRRYPQQAPQQGGYPPDGYYRHHNSQRRTNDDEMDSAESQEKRHCPICDMNDDSSTASSTEIDDTRKPNPDLADANVNTDLNNNVIGIVQTSSRPQQNMNQNEAQFRMNNLALMYPAPAYYVDDPGFVYNEFHGGNSDNYGFIGNVSMNNELNGYGFNNHQTNVYHSMPAHHGENWMGNANLSYSYDFGDGRGQG